MPLSVIFLLSLVLIIVFHELGHFMVARIFHVAIARFSIGFGPALCSWTSKKHLTQYSLCPILLGGYVKFAENKFPNHRVYEHLSRWKKIFILLAGPIANLVFAMFLMVFVVKMDTYEPKTFIGKISKQSILEKKGISTLSKIIRCNDKPILTWSDLDNALNKRQSNLLVFENSQGMRQSLEIPKIQNTDKFFKLLGFEPYLYPIPAVIGGFSKNSPAQKQGLMLSDKIIKIDETSIQNLTQLSFWVKNHPNKKVTLEILRKGQKQTLSIVLGEQHQNHQTYGLLGVTSLPFSAFPNWFQLIKHSWLEAVNIAFKMTWKLTLLQFHSWGQVQDVFNQISGPVGIVKTAQEAWTISSKAYLLFLAWLSIGVGIINLLPIPILDGGQCLILLLGKFFPSLEKEKIKNLLFFISLVMILSLMTVGLVNDGLS
jgi:regulator of sigma E protease